MEGGNELDDDSDSANENLEVLPLPVLAKMLHWERRRRIELEQKLGLLQRRNEEREDIWLSIIAARTGESSAKKPVA
jgi:hypothetical protein